jgi:DNA helicase II / ATP-dependent DNA helicase PcrA
VSGGGILAKFLDDLNPAQKAAVTYGDGPLLIVAGAGTGKTKTLAYRVSYLISQKVSPESILLLTFTRRASEEMLKRASLVYNLDPIIMSRVWGGTFHSVANRLLRIYAESIGLSPNFTILDRSDSEDYLNVIRNELKCSNKDSRFPRKSTCLDIYSRRVNSNETLRNVIQKDFPWCLNWCDDLNRLFGEYARRKQKQSLLDYDDLLLYWYHLLQEDELAKNMGQRFAHILVDEYQDTNPLQAGILQGLRRENHNISVVGDDAQSIYGFRSASVRNILDFPSQFPGAAIIKLEQNYRSLKPILDTTNQIIAQSKERYAKDLWTMRQGGDKPQLITCVDEKDQDETVIKKVLEHYEQGVLLRQQAVLFRASSHSASLELSLASHNIPFHKYGGLGFLETAHVKDLISFLRIMENPQDEMAWFRVLQLLKGVGPSTAAAGYLHILANGGQQASLSTFRSPPSACTNIRGLVSLISEIETWGQSNPALQVEKISKFYIPLLEENYENPAPRAADIEHLGQIASRYATRQQFLTEIVLDPPAHSGDSSGPPIKDEDYLILSTIHSAKGLEWNAVYLIHAADGNLPADMATGSEAEIEEELRLTYVAMTRAKDFLYVLWPQRYYHRPNGVSDNHNYAQCSRFFTEEVMASMNCVSPDRALNLEDSRTAAKIHQNISQRINVMWD